MQLENSFSVNAPPDRVFAYLLDINKVVGCVPGAELSEVVDPATFKGKVKVKVGPITVAYNGTARITDRDDAGRSAAIEAEYRRQRAELVAGLQWWLRDVWLQTLAAPGDLLRFSQLKRPAESVAKRISPKDALENLQVLEQTQRLLYTNVQEALALEVGLLKLKL